MNNIKNSELKKMIKENAKKISNEELHNLSNMIYSILSTEINEYKYKISNLEKINYYMLIENTKLKHNKVSYKIELLPNEVFNEILNFLDFDTLLECRLISKHWNYKVSHISHRYIKVKNNEYDSSIIDDIEDFLCIWKNFLSKKIPCEEIKFYDSCDVFNEFFTELMKNEYFIGNILYVDIKYNKGMYTTGKNKFKKIYMFGKIKIVYEYLDYFKPSEIIISQTFLDFKVFKYILSYCIKQDRNINIILDNCISLKYFKKYLDLYNVDVFDKAYIEKLEINNEKVINININHFYYGKADIDYIPEYIINFIIHPCNEFGYSFKEKEEVYKKLLKI